MSKDILTCKKEDVKIFDAAPMREQQGRRKISKKVLTPESQGAKIRDVAARGTISGVK